MLLVGATEPEVGSWLHAAGHATRAVPGAEAALTALGEEPADLVIVDREPGDGLDASAVCASLREDPRLGSSWVLAITTPAPGGVVDVGGADDYLHRPFTRVQLLARARTGLRAVQQRADDALLRSLMATVPGAVYRSAWHANHRLELITDEIERISGYPADNFIASSRRTLMSIIHPDDRDGVLRAVATATDEGPFGLEYRIMRADGELRWVLDRGQLVSGAGGRLWMDGVIFDITERRAAEEALRRREIEEARNAELRASRARIVAAADAARRKIERDLHDGAQQRLVALALDVRVARARVEKEPEAAGPLFDRLAEELGATSAELRELARGIHPAVLTQRGLAAALESLAGRAPVPVEIVDAPAGRLAPTLETTAYFMVAEALTNVAKYARATHATVRVAEEDTDLVIEVRDDGVGGARADAGSGLSGLADRVGALEGTLTVVSPVGEGTLVRAELPMPPG